jgi:hypothetical protein
MVSHEIKGLFRFSKDTRPIIVRIHNINHTVIVASIKEPLFLGGLKKYQFG